MNIFGPKFVWTKTIFSKNIWTKFVLPFHSTNFLGGGSGQVRSTLPLGACDKKHHPLLLKMVQSLVIDYASKDGGISNKE